MADWAIEPFAKHHDRALFCCGQPLLDDFIRARVSQYEKRRLGKTFVAVPSGKTLVVGYSAVGLATPHVPPSDDDSQGSALNASIAMGSP